MPNSLRNKIKHLAYKGELNERERDRILNALDREEKVCEWLSSFNTESAPQCFNAVQQLKEKLNGKMN